MNEEEQRLRIALTMIWWSGGMEIPPPEMRDPASVAVRRSINEAGVAMFGDNHAQIRAELVRKSNSRAVAIAIEVRNELQHGKLP